MKRLLIALAVVLGIVGMQRGEAANQGALKVKQMAKAEMKINPQTAASAAQSLSAGATAPGKVMRRIPAQTPDGDEWEMVVERDSRRWCDILNWGGVTQTFEEYPFYIVNCRLQKKTDSGSMQHEIVLPLFWPAVMAFNTESTDQTPVSFDFLVDNFGEEGTYNVFSTHGVNNGYDDDHLSIWANSAGIASIFPTTINGAGYNEFNIYSANTPSTFTLTRSSDGTGFNAKAEVHFASSDIIGVEALTLSTDFAETPFDLSVDNFKEIYLVGTAQNWDIEDINCCLERVSEESRVYSAKAFIPAGQACFRFYGMPGNWESWSIGPQSDEADVYVDFDTAGKYEGSLVMGRANSSIGKGNWNFRDWAGGIMQLTVDLDNEKVTFEEVEEPEAFYPVFYDLSGTVDVASSKIKKTGEGTYEGDVVIPAEYKENGINVQFLLSDKADNVYSKDNCNVSRKSGSWIELDRIEKQEEMSVIRGYSFGFDGYKGTRIHVKLNLAEGTVKLSNPDTAPVTAEDVKLTVDPALPETLEIGKPYEVRVTFDPEVYRDADLWDEDGPTFDTWFKHKADNDAYVFTMVATEVGEHGISITSDLHREGGFEPLRLTFNCVAPAYVATTGDAITVKGKDSNGTPVEFKLTKQEEGVYSGLASVDAQMYFRLYFTTPEGEVTLGNIRGWVNESLPDGSEFIFNNGEEYGMGRRYTLHDVSSLMQENIINYYLSTYDYNGKARFTVDLNKMTLKLSDPDFVPYISSETTEVVSRLSSDFAVMVKSNVTDFGQEEVTIDNPDLVRYEWREYLNQGEYAYHFYAGDMEGETDIHIATPQLQEEGLELVIHVKVGDFKVETITLSENDLTMVEGEFRNVTITTDPVGFNYYDIDCESDAVKAFEYDREAKKYNMLVLGIEPGESLIRISEYGSTVEATLNVHVLPRGSVVAEHIVYTALAEGATTQLSLTPHSDGSAAAPSWSSSDRSVATVDGEGNVTALKAGKAVVTADCGDHQIMAGIHVTGPSGVEETPVSNVRVYSQGTTVTVAGSSEGQIVNIYSTDGTLLRSRMSDGGTLTFDLGVKAVFVVTVAGESFKVVL